MMKNLIESPVYTLYLLDILTSNSTEKHEKRNKEKLAARR